MRTESEVRTNVLVGATLWSCIVYFAALTILMGLTGCSGLEIGGKAGIYAVQDREYTEHQRATAKPLKCLWMNCNTEASGS